MFGSSSLIAYILAILPFSSLVHATFEYGHFYHPTSSIVIERQIPGVIASSQFLRRAFHASVVADGFVYIDGGELSFRNDGNTTIQYSNTILSINLAHNWTNSSVVIQSTAKPSGCPSLNAPSLWYHESESLLYTGFTGWASSYGDDPSLPPESIWTFKPDGTGGGSWAQVIDSNAPIWKTLTRPSIAAQSFDENSAWTLGGYASAEGDGIIPGMVEFDMAAKTFTNTSSSNYLNASGAVVAGALHYIPNYGPEGIYVSLGGDTTKDEKGLLSFSTVSVFDPSKKQFFNQTTSGSPPSPRINFCSAGMSSTNGTYEIFIYAGWGTNLGSDAIPYDTINILSLPSFNWFSVPYNPSNPRHGLTCEAIGGSQVLIIGGVDSNSKQTTGDTQEIDESTFSSPDPFLQGLAIFDMTSLEFVDHYTAGQTTYVQSDMVQQFYQQPDHSHLLFLTDGVGALLNITHFNLTSTNTTASSNGSHHTSTATIAGAVVGGVIGLAILIGLISFFLKRRRHTQYKTANSAASDGEYYEGSAGQGHVLHDMYKDQKPPESAELGDRGPVEIGHQEGGVRMAELDDGFRDYR